ncbi:MAG: hypothetical protein BA865_01495 [Desulfobacterales bacterium S5133MH4]|nr:MAG: hypothetical protein BA865_01495 [Desulfobacterales bacterium S5133MH4]
MSIDLFHRLIPFLSYTDLVYLQGWGEPLLNKHIFEMVRFCKERGKRVGFTTNGMLLTEDRIRMLVDLELDILGVSLAGTTAGTHNRIRKGTDYDKLVFNLDLLSKIKAERKVKAPEVHLAYLMLRSNFHELKEILPLAIRVGAKEIVAGNLTLIVDPKLSAQAIFNYSGSIEPQKRANKSKNGKLPYGRRSPTACPPGRRALWAGGCGELQYYRSRLEEIRKRACRENIIFDYHGPGIDDASLYCRENVRRACVINVNGEVVPCVFTNPVLCENRGLGNGRSSCYMFKGQFFPLTGISFGNIQNETLTRIWNKKEYAGFRDLFDPETATRPEQILSEMPKCCVKCYKRLGV